ncbi:MAG: tRNA (adenosine(37)-N6)-threonylcarbamoyltransferase complex dimerization subunit type 1 TsaB [Candidatus Cloacimonetes bacterium]|nr:tRNA (adenosine(37)-N6)-threonylcarbamoyltransferase complex dimerization subunit type 1 TsaB [Candidatus Cloacimonadota bacterium]
MLTLAIDTTSSSGSFAFAEKDELLYEQFFKVQVTHSETLMPSLDSALRSLNRSVQDIGRIIICIGPGSFTGIRIGLATVKGICYGLNAPIVAFNSLELNAVSLYGAKYPILSFIDARMKEVYAAVYSPELDIMIPPQNCNPEVFLENIQTPLIAVGSGVREYIHLLEANENIVIAPFHLQSPKASGLITLDKLRPDSIDFDIEKLMNLEPEYLRASQAELARKK